MSFAVDKYLDRKFNLQNYNCWDLVREAWLELKGVDVGNRTPNPPTALSRIKRFRDQEKDFTKLEKPESPCIALFKRPKLIPHVGIYYKGKVLHLPETGAAYQAVELIMKTGFTQVGYYK
jgi:hypothetical protein